MTITFLLLAGTVRLRQVVESNHFQIILIHFLPQNSTGGILSCNHSADLFV